MKFHRSIDVRNLLLSDRNLAGAFMDSKGHNVSHKNAKHFLIENLCAGRFFIKHPECDNFDEKKGCEGHPEEQEVCQKPPLAEKSN